MIGYWFLPIYLIFPAFSRACTPLIASVSQSVSQFLSPSTELLQATTLKVNSQSSPNFARSYICLRCRSSLILVLIDELRHWLLLRKVREKKNWRREIWSLMLSCWNFLNINTLFFLPYIIRACTLLIASMNESVSQWVSPSTELLQVTTLKVLDRSSPNFASSNICLRCRSSLILVLIDELRRWLVLRNVKTKKMATRNLKFDALLLKFLEY